MQTAVCYCLYNFISENSSYFEYLLFCAINRIVQSINFINFTEVSKLQSITIDVIHYNRKKERIDIHSDESQEKIKEAVFYIINNKI